MSKFSNIATGYFQKAANTYSTVCDRFPSEQYQTDPSSEFLVDWLWVGGGGGEEVGERWWGRGGGGEEAGERRGGEEEEEC